MNLSNGTGVETTEQSTAGEIGWLLSSFAHRTVGVNEAVAVSTDGFVLAASEESTPVGVEQLAAIIAGLTSLARGAANLCQMNQVHQIVVEMDGGYFFVMSAGDGSTIGVLADPMCDVGLVGYELTLLIERVGSLLTPTLIDELKDAFSSQQAEAGQFPEDPYGPSGHHGPGPSHSADGAYSTEGAR